MEGLPLSHPVPEESGGMVSTPMRLLMPRHSYYLAALYVWRT
jgi:hypothetical protein